MEPGYQEISSKSPNANAKAPTAVTLFRFSSNLQTAALPSKDGNSSNLGSESVDIAKFAAEKALEKKDLPRSVDKPS